LIEGAEHQPLDHLVQMRALVGVHDARCIAAQFQRYLLVPGMGFQIPADLPAGEREQFQAFVLH